MVLILSIQHDISTDLVMDWLELHGIPVLRINGDEKKWLFKQVTPEGVFFESQETGDIVNLSECSACWWRRSGIRKEHYYSIDSNNPSGYSDKNIGINSVIPQIISNEVSGLHEYVLSRLKNDIPIQLGNPRMDLNRLVVLDMAKKLGLETPRFEVITNSEQLESAQKAMGGIVTKAIVNGVYDVIGNERYYTYTELIPDDFVTPEVLTPFAPSLVTALIKKQFEIRSFFLDGKFYSMAIFSQGSEETKIDYRIAPPPVEIPYQLPEDIEKKLTELYKQLDLNTGSADLIVDENGEYIFLEINPVGQFGMTSVPCNYNLEEKIANYLTHGTGKCLSSEL